MDLYDLYKKHEKIEKILNPPLLKLFNDIRENNILIKFDFWTKLKPDINIIPNFNPPISYNYLIEVIEKFNQINFESEFDIKAIYPSLYNEVKYHNYLNETTKYNLFPEIDIQSEDGKYILNESIQIKKIIRDIYASNKTLFKISSREFEKVVAELLRSQGFEVTLTKQTRDKGFDILAFYHIKGQNPIKFLVECKRYSEKRPVGVEIIRTFNDVVRTENANKGIIATTSYFTRDSKIKRNIAPYILEFKDRVEIIEWINEYVEII